MRISLNNLKMVI